MTDLRVVAAGPAHIAVLAALHQACFDPALETVWDDKAVAELLAMPGAYAFVVIGDAGPLGFALARTAADEAEIISIATVPETRRTGVGSLLMDAVKERAASDGASCLFLEVAADNDTARAFYLKQQFTTRGRRRGYYKRPQGREDADVMVCELRSIDVNFV